jgi:hypothetical protein
MQRTFFGPAALSVGHLRSAMDAVISALERTLSQTHEPELRQQLIDTIERLRKQKDDQEPKRG